MPQGPMLYVLLGAAIALTGSVLTTWVQGALMRRASARDATQGAVRELWRVFMAERESEDSGIAGVTAGQGLGEAELLTATITDRRTRERVTLVTRLLRECELPEMAELSGISAPRARQLLCAHVLDVLGTQLRNERLPALPEAVQELQRVESEALKIHAGGSTSSRSVASATEAETDETPATTTTSRGKARRRPRTAQPETESSSSSTASAASTSTSATSS